jgi:hypothetical protein
MLLFCLREPGKTRPCSDSLPAGRSGVRIPADARYFLFSKTVQISSALQSTQPLTKLVPGLILGGKRRRPEVYHSPPPSAEVKNEWSITSTSPLYLHDVGRYNSTFFFYFGVIISYFSFI